MAIGQGVLKQSRWKRQAAKGTVAAAAGAQVMRRQTSIFELKKMVFDTMAEINSTQQLVSNRHGPREVTGAIQGFLSPGTYADFMAALMRRDFAVVTTIAAAGITIAGTGPVYTVTRAAGSFLTDGIKVGYVVRLTVGGLNASNINKNLFVTAVTATVLTVLVVNNTALVAEGPIAGTSVVVPGKVTFTPQTGHTQIYYSYEEWYPDVPSSELFTDVRFGQAQFTLPGSGNATVSFSANGLNVTAAAAAYFTTPTVEGTAEVVSAATALLTVGGVTQAAVTNLQFTVDGNQKVAEPVVGNVQRPDVFVGKVKVSGTFTAYYDTTVLRDAFINETQTSLLAVLANGTGAAADFQAFTINNMNVNSTTPDTRKPASSVPTRLSPNTTIPAVPVSPRSSPRSRCRTALLPDSM
jgi:hypothetical protein